MVIDNQDAIAPKERTFVYESFGRGRLQKLAHADASSAGAADFQ
jgi:hypothetical protein